MLCLSSVITFPEIDGLLVEIIRVYDGFAF